MPGTVGRLAFTCGHAVTSGENEAGVPTVTIWRVLP